MDWRNDINVLYQPLKELARHGNDRTILGVLTEGVPELTDEEYDGWNGGSTSFTLAIYVPVPLWLAIENNLEAVEAKVLERAQKITRADPHQYVAKVVIQPTLDPSQTLIPPQETLFWLSGHFRLFISHLSADKIRAANLKSYLQHFAISGFIAHEDIEPTKEWQGEIEKALFSMDALVAILSRKFHESKWTDQEVGLALGRRVAVLPIKIDLDPYGLMGKFQAIPGQTRTVPQVAQSIVSALLSNPKTQRRYVACLVEQLLASPNAAEATKKLETLERADEIVADELKRLQEQGATSSAIRDDNALFEGVNALLAKHGMDPIRIGSKSMSFPDDEIPF